MKFIDIGCNFIFGVMLGFEYVEDEGDKSIVIDLLILRLLITWGDV